MRDRTVGLPGSEGRRHHRDVRRARGPANLRRRRERGAHAPYPRTARVNELLREILAEELERLSDAEDLPRLVTVTAVQTAPDLSTATVFVSSLDEQTAGELEDIRIRLQSAIGKQVRLKRTPRLEFCADPAVAHGMRVEEILHRVQEDHEASRAIRHDQGPDEDPQDGRIGA